MYSPRSVYLIAGRNVKFTGLIGSCILENGYDIVGREIIDTFARMQFSEQLKLIKSDLINYFWDEKVRLVAQSYGAYLLMHALCEMEDIFPGKILLFSPVLGASSTLARGVVVYPPRHKILMHLAKQNMLHNLNVEVHTGKEDKGYSPLLAQKKISAIPASNLYIIEKMGHSLDSAYVKITINNFLN